MRRENLLRLRGRLRGVSANIEALKRVGDDLRGLDDDDYPFLRGLLSVLIPLLLEVLGQVLSDLESEVGDDR
jgi:hypothetical protein